MAGSVGLSVMVLPFAVTVMVRCPVLPAKPVSGCDSSCNLVSAVPMSVSRVMCTSTLLPRMARPVNGMRACRKTRSTSSLIDCNCSLRTAAESTSSNRCEPPCRSSPSTMCRCAQLGQRRITSSEKKLGKAKRHTTRAKSRIATAFQRVKNNMDQIFLTLRRCFSSRVPASSAIKSPGRSVGRSGSLVVLYRLAFRAHVADHGAHVSDPHAIGNFNFDMIVIDDFGDFGDQTAIGHDGVASPQGFDHRLMLFHLLLLGPQDQEIHDDDDQDQRHE